MLNLSNLNISKLNNLSFKAIDYYESRDDFNEFMKNKTEFDNSPFRSGGVTTFDKFVFTGEDKKELDNLRRIDLINLMKKSSIHKKLSKKDEKELGHISCLGKERACYTNVLDSIAKAQAFLNLALKADKKGEINMSLKKEN